MSSFGLGPTGFVPQSLSEIQTDLQAKIQQAFGGTTVDLSSQSVWGQLIGIFANANADLWAMGQSLYANSSPASASGVGVDNILAVNNLTRLQAAPTVTAPDPTTDSNGFSKYGFVCFGQPGTVIPAGTLVSNGASSPLTFSVDSALTIGPASNAVQTLYFSNQPTSGTYALTLTSPAGDVLTTPQISYNADPSRTLLAYTGSSAAPSGGDWQMVLNGTTTSAVQFGQAMAIGITQNSFLTAAKIQAAINSVSAYSSATVSGDVNDGFFVAWNGVAVPSMTFTGDNPPNTVQQPVAFFVQQLENSSNVYPFTDVVLSGGTQNITFNFGGGTATQGMPTTSAVAIEPVVVASTSLFNGSQQTSTQVQTLAQGNPAQAIGSATCTTSGPNQVVAGQLNTVVTPISGFTSCINQLDCVTGRAVETDAQAIARLQSSQGAGASGSVGAIEKQLLALSGVTQVVSSQNQTNAAQQIVIISNSPTQGTFALQLGAEVTSALAYNVTPSAMQTAIQALSGYGQANVLQYGSNGYLIDFEGASGQQAQPLVQIVSNTTSCPINAYFGQPPHSVQFVVQGGVDSEIATTILQSLPAGISSYSNPDARTTATLTAGSATINVSDATNLEVGQTVTGQGIIAGTTVAQIQSQTLLLSNVASASGTDVPLSFAHNIVVTDSAGNRALVGFSRPVTTLIFVQLSLVTDMYVQPGNQSSGINPNSQFSLASVAQIQETLINTINSVPIGSVIVANGSNSLGGSFRSIPGVVSYSLAFDTVNPPVNTGNLQLATNQAPLAESFNVSCSYT